MYGISAFYVYILAVLFVTLFFSSDIPIDRSQPRIDYRLQWTGWSCNEQAPIDLASALSAKTYIGRTLLTLINFHLLIF